MRDLPLPPDLARRWANLPDVANRGRNEWSAACPQCGGADRARRGRSDRFRMFAADDGHGARGWCRQCHYFAFADDDQERPSAEAIEKATRERLALTEKENTRIRDKIKRIADSNFWHLWHTDMTPEHRRLWHREGINDWAIETYQLGYCPDHTTMYDGQEWHTPTMTIPLFAPGWEWVNLQHRLLKPPEPGDKYRQMAGLPSAMFLTEPDTAPAGPTIVVEGAKKAIVCHLNIGHLGYTIVAVPSKAPSQVILDQLDNADPVYMMLDPDAYTPTKTKTGQRLEPAASRMAKRLGRERVKVVKVPVKPDDLFTIYRGQADDMHEFIRQAVAA